MSSGKANNIEGDIYVDGVLATGSGTLVRKTGAPLTNPVIDGVTNGYTTTATAAGTTTLTVTSTFQQFFTGTSTQTVLLPVVSTLTLGQSFYIQNDSTGVVTVQSSGANTIQAMVASSVMKVTCISLSGTGTASWSYSYMILPAFVSSVTAAASPVSLTNGTDANIATVTLTPGSWDAEGNVTALPNAGVTTMTYLGAWLSLTSATLPDASLYNLQDRTGVVSLNVGSTAPSRRFTVTANTTLYLSCQAGFAVSTLTACGGIYATRL